MTSINRYGVIKRAIDLAGASAGLVALTPVMGATALAVLLDSGRPVIFRQVRVGKLGQPFTIYKFRSMRPINGAAVFPRGGADLSDGDSSRVTRVGRVIRRWAIDELPQLVNVLSGEMSLVGPRPLMPEHDGQLNGSQYSRRSVKPGLTGWAAVTGGRSRSWDERVDRDLYYVDNASTWIDLAIMILSVPAIASYGEPHGGEGRCPCAESTGKPPGSASTDG